MKLTWSARGERLIQSAVLVLMTSFIGLRSPDAVAQAVVRVKGGVLSVDAQAAPLGRLLLQIAADVPFETIMISPEAQRKPVTVAFRDLPIREGLLKIFEAADINHVVWGGKGAPFRVFAGPPEGAVPLQAPPSDAGERDPGEMGQPPRTGRHAPGSRPLEGPPDVPPFEPPTIPFFGETPPEERENPPPDPREDEHRRRRRWVTDDAFLAEPPNAAEVAGVSALLILGLAVGVPLIGYGSRPSGADTDREEPN